MAAWHAVKGGQSALSVVDEHGRFVGIISPDRLLAVLLQEHDEDMARLGGFLKNSTIARLASEESVRRRFWHRLPWLVLGLLGFFIAADIIAYFEVALKEKLVLAFFIPGIVYLADAVGTQTETVVIRGLSVGIGIGRVVLLEAITGLIIGLALSVIAAPFIFWRWGDADVALAVGLSIFTACSIATVVAMLIPWVLSRFSIDPAFGSGPVATVVQDLLSISLYFLIAILVTA
jgi:magnesium transporter